MTAYPRQSIRRTLDDARLQEAIYAATGRLMEHRRQVVAPEVLPDYQELREQARRIKEHTLNNLDAYLEQFEAQVQARGGVVVWARDGADVAEFVLDLARRSGARLLVKSKSMTTEEIGLRERLEAQHLEVVETDLGEYIIQLAGERPYHIVAPALHKTREEVGEIFSQRLGLERENAPERQTKIARAVLRQKF
ncbi:MAG: LUD domain-containing protein, partial [Bryobacteraceae bacterium]